jgi:hypothetical protein
MNYCLSSTAVGPNRWGNGTYRERMPLTVTACGHRPHPSTGRTTK